MIQRFIINYITFRPVIQRFSINYITFRPVIQRFSINYITFRPVIQHFSINYITFRPVIQRFNINYITFRLGSVLVILLLLCVAFFVFVLFLWAQCCQFLWIVYYYVPLRVSLMFIFMYLWTFHSAVEEGRRSWTLFWSCVLIELCMLHLHYFYSAAYYHIFYVLIEYAQFYAQRRGTVVIVIV